MTERDRIARWLEREGYPELADKLLRYADREPPKPDIPASEWIKRPSVGR